MNSNPPGPNTQPDTDKHGRPHLRHLSDQELWDKFDSRDDEFGVNDMSDEAADRMFAWHENWDKPPPVADDLIPEVEPVRREATEFDRALDTALDGMTIVDAYTRWGTKNYTPRVGSKRESIMIRCPNPQHPDKHPSAWLNLDKDVWMCGGCQEGGDKYDLAGWHYGYPVPEYKTNGSFPALRREIAADLGIQEVKTLSGSSTTLPVLTGDLVDSPEDVPDNADIGTEEDKDVVIGPDLGTGLDPGLTPESSEISEEEPKLASVTTLPGTPLPEVLSETPHLDWESLVGEDDFLAQWMKAVTIDDFPHEYRFWMGLQALGFAAGRTVTLVDNPPVIGNLFLCLFGATGTSKTRSMAVYSELLEEVFPYEEGDEFSEPVGVEAMPEPASGEALVDMFAHPLQDPSTMKVTGHASVSGLLRIEEFASFVAKANRSGSTLKTQTIDMYDGKRFVSIKSRAVGRTLAKDPFCQMLTTTQPEAIHAFLSRTDGQSGFLNRWIFPMGKPRRPPIHYMPGTPNIDIPIEKLKVIKKWAEKTRRMHLTGDALDAWNDFCDHNGLSEAREEDVAAILNRVELASKKLILLFAVNNMHENPTVADVECAISIFPYLLHTYQKVVKNLTYTPHDRCADDIITAIAEHIGRKQVPSMRNISHSLRRRHDRFIIAKTVQNMVAIGQISEFAYKEDKAKAGPPKTIFLDAESEAMWPVPPDGSLRPTKK